MTDLYSRWWPTAFKRQFADLDSSSVQQRIYHTLWHMVCVRYSNFSRHCRLLTPPMRINMTVNSAIRASISPTSSIASTTQNSLIASAIPDPSKMFHIPRPEVSIGTIEELDRISDLDISISPGRSIRRRSGSRGDAMRRPPPSIASLAIAISSTTLERLREAAQDYGHLNHFFREADEAFADEMTAAYGESRTPIPLLIPLDNDFYIPCYAVLLSIGCRSQICWDTYHRGLMTIMQRVARETGVSAMLPVVYLRETLYDDLYFQNIDDMYMREREMVSAPVLEGNWPQDFSSTFNLYN